jgi:hypothetical protein
MAGPDIGAQMRAQVLALNPSTVGLKPQSGPMWGFVMDVVISDTDWYALVVLADGTTSLYTSSTFGIIGGGSHETVREAGRALWETAAELSAVFVAMTDTSLPAPGSTTLRLLRFDGHRVIVADDRELGGAQHPVSPVFYAAHEVLGRLRLVTASAHP